MTKKRLNEFWALTKGTEYMKGFPNEVPLLFETRAMARVERHNNWTHEVRVQKVQIFVARK